jgi:hypothetical protein
VKNSNAVGDRGHTGLREAGQVEQAMDTPDLTRRRASHPLQHLAENVLFEEHEPTAVGLHKRGIKWIDMLKQTLHHSCNYVSNKN